MIQVAFLSTIFLISVGKVSAMSCTDIENCRPSKFQAILPIVIFESVVIGGSSLAAYQPAVGGALGAYISVYELFPKKESRGSWVGFLSGISLSTYTAVQEKSSYSKTNLFLTNFIGWHVTLFAHDYFSRNKYNIVVTPRFIGSSKDATITLSKTF